ncbi:MULTISPECIES: NPP1 family protein [Microbulbifer]|uniref:NPP1 family protein n=1 Tax=Microbulbifer celer TaxID=435905 RepID=A0ABW3UCZ4_9GAMM|nr:MULTISPECIES: NPP1 family protein [Microbulbifer]UFN57471.1 NPP1 family protein [Microbulbifer celer]
MKLKTFGLSFGLALLASIPALASDFAKLDQALPDSVDAVSIAPVFDFDGDGCYPSAGISRNGDINGGLKPSGSLDGSCSSTNFMDISNTVHRYACIDYGGASYCGHFYALYFEKDQLFEGIESGHRHDWEFAAVWTKNGNVTHGSYSYHRTVVTLDAAKIPTDDNGHMKFVYHKDGISTHALRLAKHNEVAENPYGVFVTPTITSWYELYGDGWNNEVMRTLLDNFDYGDANLPVNHNNFLNKLNTYKPDGYPDFTETSLTASNPGVEGRYLEYVNNASGLCLDIDAANMENGTNVLQWNCNDGNWQKWYYEESTGLIRSRHDPRYCLDNGGVYASNANIMIWTCNGGSSQRFTLNSNGSISVTAEPTQVIDGFGINAGDDVGTWSYTGGTNQHWLRQE